MSVTLICPRCNATTELRGSMDAWYLTWCPECERLWRFDLRSLLEEKPPDARTMPPPARLRQRSPE